MGSGEREHAAGSRDRSDAPGKLCEVCGAVIDTSEWYPVTNERDADGTLQIYAFCSQACQDAWHEE